MTSSGSVAEIRLARAVHAHSDGKFQTADLADRRRL